MDKKQITKRLMALVLSLIMVIGILPLDVFATSIITTKSITENANVENNNLTISEPRKIDQVKSENPSEGENSTRGAADPSTWANPVNESAPGKTSSRAVDTEGKPPVDWDKSSGEGRDDGSSYWSLPAGVKVVNAYNGSDPTDTFGFTYLGRYLDDQGRIVLKFDIGHRGKDSGVWDKYVMRFPKELYNAIDTDSSFILWKQTEVYRIDNFDRFETTTIREQTAYTYQFPFRNFGAQYGHREVNVVLKKDVDWDKYFEGKSQVVQLRLYNGNNDNLKIYSTSARGVDKKYSSFGYNTHTKTAVVGDLSKRPGDLIESTTISMLQSSAYNDIFHTADSTLQLDRENKKVRIIYSVAKTGTTRGDYKAFGEDIGLRQTLDPDFVRYLDLTDPETKIGTYQLFYPSEKKYGEPIDIFAKDLNGVKKTADGKIELDENNNPIYTRDDKSVFIQFGSKEFATKDNPEASDKNHVYTKITDSVNFYYQGDQTNGALGVFEYNIDPNRINANMIENKEFSKNFMFDTRYITSNNEGMRKYTGVLEEDIVYPPGKNVFYRLIPEPYESITTSISSGNKAADFILNIGGADGIWKSWKREGTAWFNDGTNAYAISPYGKEMHLTPHTMTIGGTIPKGTPITVYLPKDYSAKADKIHFDLATGDQLGVTKAQLTNAKSLMGGKKVTLKKVKKANGSDIFYNPLYIKNTVSTIGGSAIREQYTPIVDEIFTDSKDFTGIMRTEGGVLASLYKPKENGTDEHFGENWIDSDSDDKGEITGYERTDGKLKDKESPEAVNPDDISEKRTVKGLDKFNQVVDKEFEGLRFTIKKLYFGGDDFAKSNQETKVEDMGLIKDQPVMFNSFRHTSLQSAPVYEQVQAKVKFMLYPKQNVAMDKIVPLNKEYSIEPEKLNAKGLEEAKRLDTTGKPNPNYKGNGFKAKEGENNIRVDEDHPTISVKRKSLTETDAFDKDKDVTYPNFLNHDGYAYGVNSSDPAIKDRAVQEFIKRLYPDAEFDEALSSNYDATPRKDGKTVIGWTTKELVDTPTKDAIDQFYELEKDKKVLTDLSQWKDVDEDKQTYIFNEYSPVDKNRTVYAVWGTPSLVLHSNNTTLDKETIVRIPFTPDDVTTTNNIIDAMTSATKDNLKNNNVIKKLPLAPYKYRSKALGEYFDPRLENFIMENSTFVGWTLDRHTNDKNSDFIAGNNNERIGEIQKGETKAGKSLPKRTESTEYLGNYKDAYVPNGYNFAVSKGYEALMKEGKDIHLYANYRPYFDVKVQPRYMNIGEADATHAHGKYVNTVEQAKKKPLEIALLYRTAVTDYTKPTVLQGATYNPLTKNDLLLDSDEVIKPWNGKNKVLTWKTPGFDREGMRQSYVAVVVPQGKTEAYKKFKQDNGQGGIYDWNSLGITTYVKLSGQSAELDKGAPRNLHETISRGDPYGIGLAKQQNFGVETNGKVDAFTSATSRQATVRKARETKEEVTGYNIFLTNTPQSMPTPEFNSVKETDKTISINFGPSLVNEKLKALKLKIPTSTDGKTTTYKDIRFEIGTDGKTFTAPDGMTATLDENTGKLTIGEFNFEGLPADEPNRTIYGTYVKEVGAEGAKTEVEGDKGKVVITRVLVSNPVEQMNQIMKKGEDKARLEFVIPNPGPTDQVVSGTTYTAQKFDGQKWVDVGEITVRGTNLGGTTTEMPITGEVSDGDLIRIKSKEPGKLEAYSVGNKDSGAYTPLGPDPKTPNAPPADTGHYVKLDLVGPEATGKAVDERFRRYINIDATLDEVPGKEVTIEIGTKGVKGAEGNQVFTGDKDQVIKFYNEIAHNEDITLHGVWITATDEFGNEKTTKLKYDQTYQLELTLRNPRVGRNFVRLKSEKANTSVNLTFINDAQEVLHTQTFTINKADEFQKFTLSNNYKLEKNTQIIIEGSCVEGSGKDAKVYTNNPWIHEIR
ncbi:hypothetical protein [Peptoniphilus sp.]|uniref:hypothetical protein n=1 Tax=Peptoniphilus sp. TaxID=1971214 RepID=UPI003993B6FF